MNDKKKLLVGNWKMNPPSLKEAGSLFRLIERGVQKIEKTEVVVCPPFVYLGELEAGSVKLGAQNCSGEEGGPHTGEISPLMLKNLGCEYVILGHSERRRLGETSEIIRKKIKGAIDVGLKPIVCIGESKAEREEGKTKEVLTEQLSFLPEMQGAPIIAYEPIWAIGTGDSCSLDKAKGSLHAIRGIVGGETPILYGGSADSNNAENFIGAGFDGLLIGAKSLDAEEFVEIAEKLEV